MGDGDRATRLLLGHVHIDEVERLPVIGDQLCPGEPGAGEVASTVFHLQQRVVDAHADDGVVVDADLHQQLGLVSVVGFRRVVDHQACLHLGVDRQDVLGVVGHLPAPAVEQHVRILLDLNAAILAVAQVGLLHILSAQAPRVEHSLDFAELYRLPLVGGAVQDVQLDLAELDAGVVSCVGLARGDVHPGVDGLPVLVADQVFVDELVLPVFRGVRAAGVVAHDDMAGTCVAAAMIVCVASQIDVVEFLHVVDHGLQLFGRCLDR